MVDPAAGATVLASTGDHRYRELQISVRQVWTPEAQLFVSYEHAASRGESNDSGTIFTNLDTALLEPGEQVRR